MSRPWRFQFALLAGLLAGCCLAAGWLSRGGGWKSAGLPGLAAVGLAIALRLELGRRQARESERQAGAAAQYVQSGRPLAAGEPEATRLLVESLRPLWEERQALARQAQEQTTRLRAILDALDTALVAVDAERRVLFANAAAARLFHWGPTPQAGERIPALPRIAQLESWAREVQAQGEPAGGRLLLPDERTLQVNLSPLPAAGFVLLARDISHEVRMEAQRRDFIAAVSHELRTPLAAIQGYAESLLDAGAPPAATSAQEHLRIILANTQRLARLARDLVMLASLETGAYPYRFETAEAAALAAGAGDTLRPLAEEQGCTLRLGPLESGQVRVDADAWQRVLTNLLENAILHGGRGAEVRLSGQRREGEYCWKVADNGVGISWRDQARIFERFYRADRARTRGGSGLGLALVKHLVQDHGGRITLESSLGQGACFQVYLPLAAAQPPTRETPDPAAQTASGRG